MDVEEAREVSKVISGMRCNLPTPHNGNRGDCTNISYDSKKMFLTTIGNITNI